VTGLCFEFGRTPTLVLAACICSRDILSALRDPVVNDVYWAIQTTS
jgi:hypothetical protein